MIYNSKSSILDALVTFGWEIQRTVSGLVTNFVELACTETIINVHFLVI